MKVGINAWTLPVGLAMGEAFKLVKTAGFETIELNVSEEDNDIDVPGLTSLGTCSIPTTISNEELDKVNQLSQKYELPISSISTNLHWKYPLNSTDSSLRQKGIDIGRKMIDFCKTLGGDAVLIVPGVITENDNYEESYKLSQDSLKELALHAEKTNIEIGVENVWNQFLLTPLEMKRFIDEINHASVKVYFDVGNVLQYGFPNQWIQTLGSRIAKVHVKDFRKDIGNITGFTSLLSGDLNWPKTISALRDINYNGPLTAELTPYTHIPEQLIKDTAQAIKTIIKM